MLRVKYVLFLLVLFFLPVLIHADETERCEPLIQERASNIMEICQITGRNQICYGNQAIIAQSASHIENLKFDAVGDIQDIEKIQSLRLSSMNLEDDIWGVALLKLQANLPRTMPEDVTVLMVGDVTAQPQPPTAEYLATILSDQNVNIRSNASTSSRVLDSVAPQAQVMVSGRNAEGDWLRVRLPDQMGIGWISTSLVAIDDVDSIPVVTSATPIYGPMQAFVFGSGLDNTACEEAPPNGILIQTPKASGEIVFLIDEVVIELGSTVFLQAVADDYLYVYVLEGHATLTALETSVTVNAGEVGLVPLDDNLIASGAPLDPTPYEDDELETFDPLLSLLPLGVGITSDSPDTTTTTVTTGDCTITATGAVNLRGGPGTDYGVVGSLNGGDSATPDGSATGSDGFQWLRLNGSQWVRSDVISLNGACDNLTTITDLPPTPTPSPIVSTTGSTSTSSNSNARITTVYALWQQSGHSCPVTSGTTRVMFTNGAGGQPTEEAANNFGASQYARVTIDGATTIPITNYRNTTNDSFAGGWVSHWDSAVIDLEAGEHTLLFEVTYNDTGFYVSGVCSYTAR